MQIVRIAGHPYALVYRFRFAADWKAALGAYCLQSSGSFPCVKCQAMHHKQLVAKECPQCHTWPCWHNGLLAVQPEIRAEMIVKHADECNVPALKPVLAPGKQGGAAVAGAISAHSDAGEADDAASEGSAASNLGAAVLSNLAASMCLPPIRQEDRLYNCTV